MQGVIVGTTRTQTSNMVSGVMRGKSHVSFSLVPDWRRRQLLRCDWLGNCTRFIESPCHNTTRQRTECEQFPSCKLGLFSSLLSVRTRKTIFSGKQTLHVHKKFQPTSFSCLILRSSNCRLNSLACFSRRLFERARSSSTFSIYRIETCLAS